MELILDRQIGENGKVGDVISRAGVRGTGRCVCVCLRVCVCTQVPPFGSLSGRDIWETLPHSGRIESCG